MLIVELNRCQLCWAYVPITGQLELCRHCHVHVAHLANESAMRCHPAMNKQIEHIVRWPT